MKKIRNADESSLGGGGNFEGDLRTKHKPKGISALADEDTKKTEHITKRPMDPYRIYRGREKIADPRERDLRVKISSGKCNPC